MIARGSCTIDFDINASRLRYVPGQESDSGVSQAQLSAKVIKRPQDSLSHGRPAYVALKALINLRDSENEVRWLRIPRHTISTDKVIDDLSLE